MMEDLFASLYFLCGFFILFPLVYLLILKIGEIRERKENASKSIKAHIVYLNHTVEEVQVADADTLEEVVRERLTAKLTASPDMDVSTLVVCWELFEGYWKLKLFSANVSSDPAEAPILTEAASGTIEFAEPPTRIGGKKEGGNL